MAKRKLSEYNLHVKREMKAGKSMKQAAASWKGSAKKPSKSVVKMGKKRKATRTRTVYKKARSVGKKLLGNVGIKGALIGGATYFAASALMPKIGGAYSPAVNKVASGMAAKAMGVSGAAMIGAGAMEAVAIGISQFLSGGLGIGNKNVGGYDY